MIQSLITENENSKDMNNQLKDLLKTYTDEINRQKSDFNYKEDDLHRQIKDLRMALANQERKMIDNVIEGIDMKHQQFNHQSDDWMAQMDREVDRMKDNRKKLQQALDQDEGFEARKSGVTEENQRESLPLKKEPSGERKTKGLAAEIDKDEYLADFDEDF